jgi:hypothetical protein
VRALREVDSGAVTQAEMARRLGVNVQGRGIRWKPTRRRSRPDSTRSFHPRQMERSQRFRTLGR